MIIPSSVKILGHEYVVKKIELGSGHEICGDCDASASVIRINTQITRTQMESTFLHEVIEAINSLLDLGLAHPQIMGVEVGLYQVLTENGLLREIADLGERE